MDPIYIHTEKDYFDFRNTSPHKVKYKGIHYLTAENLFQALKFLGKNDRKAIELRLCDDPLGKAHDSDSDDLKRSDWFDVNKKMLEIALYYKFNQHQDLKNKLLATTGRKLINNVTDRFWGIGEDHKGENNFGQVLEKVRGDLQNVTPAPLQIPVLNPRHFHTGIGWGYGFTNLAPLTVKHGGREWKTSGHLFQAWKFPGHAFIIRDIYNAIKSEDVIEISKRYDPLVRKDWNEVCIPIMRHIQFLKFTNSREMTQLLLDTGSVELIMKGSDSGNAEDSFWGCGADGRGQNQLGKALVRVRDIIRYGFDPPEEPPHPPKYFNP